MAVAGVPVEAPRVIAMTDARTYRAHLVTDAAAAAGRADRGCYVAVCGTVVLAASLTTPDTSFCSACARWRRRGGRAIAHSERGGGAR
jgi:hypothetical protein